MRVFSAEDREALLSLSVEDLPAEEGKGEVEEEGEAAAPDAGAPLLDLP